MNEIERLAEHGLTDEQIARELGISEEEVDNVLTEAAVAASKDRSW
jgi:orotate phosphoribosyltransferase-like protein